MNFECLQNFVNEYLIKTEPNQYWLQDPSYNNYIEKIEDSAKSEIKITNKINSKNFIGRLGLNNFDIKVEKEIDKESIEVAKGEYEVTNTEIKNACTDLHKYIMDNEIEKKTTNWDTDEEIIVKELKYGDFVTEFLVCVNKTGDDYEIFPLYSKSTLDTKKLEGDDPYDYVNKKVLDYLRIIIKFFAEKHREYVKMTKEHQRNFIYIYKLTSPYTHKIKSSSSVGMQTESAHMDQCNTGDQLIGDFYCEISSIIYTNVNNNCSPIPNYYASAAFFYGPEIPMPVGGETELTIKGEILSSEEKSYLHEKLLLYFQQNYKRLFVSAPMKSAGWAIWTNYPKRFKKNTNPVDPHSYNSTVFKPWPNRNRYTHFAADDNEFVYHASPFKSVGIQNWAPISSAKCINVEGKEVDPNISRANITVRRGNYNLFRLIRDIFDSNINISRNGLAGVDLLRMLTNCYALPELKENIDFRCDYLENINKILEEIMDIFKENDPSKKKAEDKPYCIALIQRIYKQLSILYDNFVNEIMDQMEIIDETTGKCIITKKNRIEDYENGLVLLEAYSKSCLEIIKYLIKYPELSVYEEKDLTTEQSAEKWRTELGGNYYKKYLKYKAKYLKLKYNN